MNEPQRLYKVLVDGKSCHGGSMAWSLPRHDGTRWVPGDWHTYEGEPCMCSAGLHGTINPVSWLKHGCRAYRMEAEEIKAWQGDKFVCRRARLVVPVYLPQWWHKTEGFVASLALVPWFKPDNQPDAKWKLFTAPTWDAAWDAAGDAAWDAARAAARDAAGAAARAAARAALNPTVVILQDSALALYDQMIKGEW